MKTKEVERIINKRKRLTQRELDTRSHRLKDWLEDNFVSGKFFTIEEICKYVRDEEGEPYFKLNTNPHIHDKCIALSQTVKDLNWHTGRECYIPIIKDKNGSIKLAENKEELECFINGLKRKVENANKYANHLQGLIDLADTIPFINQANRVLKDSEIKPIEVYAQ